MINIDKHFRWVSKIYFNTIFARLFFVLSIGIIVAEFSAIPTNIFLAIIVAGLSLSIFSTLRGKRLGEWIFIFSWSLFLFGSGGWMLRHKQMPDITDLSKSPHNYIVQLSTEPINKGTYYRAEAEIIYSPDSATQQLVGHNLLLNFYIDSLKQTPRLCDRYLINTRIVRPSNSGLGGFDYGKYLARNGFCGVSYVNENQFQYLSTESVLDFTQHLHSLRNKLISRFQSIGISDSSLAIISAITLGEKGLLPNEVKDSFSAAGVSHILVVSGMHVGFIFLLIMLLMRNFSQCYHWLIVILGLLILWSYAVLTGLAPSVVRATFMFSMILIFRKLGEKYRVEHALFLSATILLLCNPNTLFDIGFQLSYLAVIGIVYFYPRFYKLIRICKSKIFIFVLQSIAVTISAQILTLPIIIYHFHQFPIYFILSNLFVTLFAPILFIGGIALLPISYIPYLNIVAGWTMNSIITIFEGIISFIVSLPFSTAKLYLSFPEVIFFYIAILCLINWIELRNQFAMRFKAPLLFTISIALFAIIVLFNNLYYSNKQVLLIPDTNPLIVNVFNSQHNLLFTNRSDYAIERLEYTWLKYSCKPPTVITDTTLTANCFYFNNESYLILRDNVFSYLQNNGQPLEIDNLIIDRGVYPSERLCTEFLHPKRVILTSGVWHGYLEKYKQLLYELSIPYHIISEKGSIIISK